jgi:hypothetical protein
MGNLLVLLVIALIIAGACYKMVVDKKNGVKCSGCPYAAVGKQGCLFSEQGTHQKVL